MGRGYRNSINDFPKKNEVEAEKNQIDQIKNYLKKIDSNKKRPGKGLLLKEIFTTIL